ncbi:MAG: LPXTG cell wall anchor domain-containing protein [Acidimicrobiales bacterium]
MRTGTDARDLALIGLGLVLLGGALLARRRTIAAS